MRNLSSDQAETLQQTNPELVMTSGLHYKSKTSFSMDVRKPPFDDIRVRTAMQLAIDTETINQTLYGGLGDPTPYGTIGAATIGFYTPFEEWPEDLKANFAYDPARAKQLLAEAGYPNGFKTTLEYAEFNDSDLEYTQVAKDYWAKIGVDVEINIVDPPTLFTHLNAHTYEGMTWGNRGTNYNPLMFVRIMGYLNEEWNNSGLQDPEYDAIVEAAENASTYEEMQRLVKKADIYYIKLMPDVWGPIAPVYHFWQPWLGSYNGEFVLGGAMIHTIYARLWVDQELKESMGH